ncbi:LOW QUALITY PROTEIN: nucleolar protein 58 [Drosophila sulfurigaster albostrigata]|uniref:Nucleolar protein 58 n=1 Tax=Drosophila albomicans TaxID=7291 RepID=A0A6P8WLW7_DROAB|nr:nucleolar protein 58 [Drosophila albomicans]XP_060645003.1 nucleolar protein 58 [Drosophila nasuta]XP_062120658.1 LOW QUALITY PROTEIN: nucleolar protein 58 [Drosophila sulfurigaster albostrigata]
MFVLYETPAGYAIFKLLDEKKLEQVDNLYLEFETPEKANKLLKLKHFEKFNDTTEALAAATAAVEGKVAKPLKKTLKKLLVDDVQASLLVADAKLGTAIKDKLSVQCVYNTGVQELMRCIRQQADSLLGGLPKREMTAMALGLAHSLSRYKLKFSPDKIDTMIVQAQCLLDDLDKELNNYLMRAREWYGWHFPELGKLITDNIAFVKTIKLVGTRDNMAATDLSDILPEDVEQQVKEAAEISMGTEISDEDVLNIQCLCDEIISINDYRTHLYDYLKARMMAMAPNLTVLVGDTVGARLIAHAGSLINLAKHPSSTVQILGAEKALFRALKTKKDTPKYGLIYHAQLVGQASQKNKGKMSRSLAAKASLATRVDAFGEEATFELGATHKVKLEARLRLLEEGNLRKLSGTGKAKAKFEKYQAKSEVFTYQPEADNTLQVKKRKHSEVETPVKQEEEQEEVAADESEIKTEKKKKKKKKQKDEEAPEPEAAAPAEAEDEAPAQPAKKKKKSKHQE